MRLLLLLALMVSTLPTQAGRIPDRATASQQSPAQDMVQTLHSMRFVLDGVKDKPSADAAAPKLLELNRQFHARQAAAEDMPPMTDAALNRHLSRMDQAMNDFRLACARVLQEKCYGSTQLGKAVKKVAQGF